MTVFELRQYTLHPGRRDELIELFEREFVEPQEAAGMRLAGQFRSLDDPDRFVWLRGFRDMRSRAQALQAFYGGPVWRAHRDAANATMIDSDDVLLLRPVEPADGFALPSAARPKPGAHEVPATLVVASLYVRDAPVDEAFRTAFARDVKPLLIETGAAPLASFETEYAQNTYPALPVRTGEHVFVWFSAFANEAAYDEHRARLQGSDVWNQRALPALSARAAGAPQHLRLRPTSRSTLR